MEIIDADGHVNDRPCMNVGPACSDGPVLGDDAAHREAGRGIDNDPADPGLVEMRRAVGELGMAGAMLPSNGEGIKGHYGSKIYWPLYEEAEKLNCPLAVHVGALHHLGLDTIGVYYPVHALGHPFGIMAQAAAMLAYGIFDRFPKLRVAFLEGGAGWVPFFMERLDRSYPHHLQVDINGEFLHSSQSQVMASEYFRRHVQAGRIFVGFDGDDQGLGYAVRQSGNHPFLFATDFPHESFDAPSCRTEIKHILEREDLNQVDKEAILGGNAKKFYAIA